MRAQVTIEIVWCIPSSLDDVSATEEFEMTIVIITFLDYPQYNLTWRLFISGILKQFEHNMHPHFIINLIVLVFFRVDLGC